MPHSSDLEYAERSIPQYERAVMLAGGEPVCIELDRSDAEVRGIIKTCEGVLLPGSKADVEPARFNAERSPHTAAADPRRDAVDDLLLADAYQNHKPVLGICYGLQSLNVFRGGSLIQHIPDFLDEEKRSKVNHEAGRTVPIAHTVEIESNSMLAAIVTGEKSKNQKKDGVIRPDADEKKTSTSTQNGKIVVPVNSSHHQSADSMGEGLRIVAHCTDDGIIEAIEGTAPDHFIVAVQWHPERSVDDDAASRSIFSALIKAAEWPRDI
jgi:putative glutamine amidotransferase